MNSFITGLQTCTVVFTVLEYSDHNKELQNSFDEHYFALSSMCRQLKNKIGLVSVYGST